MDEPRPIATDDAALVRAALSGDRAAFAAIYDRYADRLHDFCWSMLRNRDEAADAMQDTFLIAAEKLSQLRNPERLRPWLYAIARSQTLRRFRARRRVEPDAEMGDVADPAEGPHRAAEQADLQALVWDAAAGLAERDRALLDLHLRQGLDGAELGEAMGVNANHAAVLLHRLRAQVERSLGALLVARLGSEDCSELARILTGWDGRFSPLLRKRVARHVDGCEVCDERRRTVASPVALLSAVPLMPAPLELRDRVLGQVELTAHRDPGAADSGRPGPPRPPGGAIAAGAAAAILVIGVIGALVLPQVRGGAGEETVAAATDPSPRVAAPLTIGDAASEPQPDSPDPTPEPTVEPSPTTTDPPTSEPQTLEPQTPEPGSPQPPAAPPALLAVSTDTIDLGTGERTGSVMLRNDGGQALEWTAAPGAAWVALEPGAGRLEAGASAELVVTADRAALGEGPARSTVTIDWGGGQEVIAVLLIEERPPVIGPAALTPPRIVVLPCEDDRAWLIVTISDESGVAAATARWSGSGSGSVALALRNGTWQAPVGPVGQPGLVQVIVEATDTRGNTASGSPVALGVDPCVQVF